MYELSSKQKSVLRLLIKTSGRYWGPMKKSAQFITALLSIPYLFSSISHAGQCTQEEITKLKDSGYAQPEMDQLCSKFHPDNYSVLKATKGNLNCDNIDDIVLVLKKDGEKDNWESDQPEKRPLYLLIGQSDGSYKLAAKNDNAVYCVHCGGVMGDPFVGITIKNGYFSVEHYGGSAWRWTRIVTFKYSDAEKTWFLHKDGGEYFHVLKEEQTETKVKTVEDFGIVPFEQYDLYKEES
jgi:hypothetical protein